MSKVAIIYESKYGSTKKYAEWIADEINGDLFKSSEITVGKLADYDTITFGGGIYANGIAGISLITKNYESLKNKKIIVFTVGISSVDKNEVFTPIIEKTFSKDMQSHIKFFHFRGAIDYKELGLIHKSMMAMLKTNIAKKGVRKLTDEEIEIIVSKKGKLDYTDRNSIQPLIDYLKK